ncbi:MAG: sigma factor-like helix-turn-helix DNA-binding protein [Chthoniobacteraceae bacterium]
MSTTPFSASINALPTAHLQLGRRAYNGCLELKCLTIGDVLRGLENGLITSVSVGRKTAEEIAHAVQSLAAFAQDGRVDRDSFWKVRGLAGDYIALTSAGLACVAPEIRSCGLGSLHLKKACSGLSAVGIVTIGQLIDAAHAGIDKLKNFGAAARTEVVAALPALSAVVAADGQVDWCDYATALGLPLIPESAVDDITGESVLQYLPTVCETVITAQMDERGRQIFLKRLLAAADQRVTLEGIGGVYGITRERVRQIEAMCIDALRKPLLEADYFGLSFRLRPELSRVFTTARQHFLSLGLPAWPESAWVNELAKLWQVAPSRIIRYDRLLMALFGYDHVSLNHAGLDMIVFDDSTSRPEAKRLAGLVEAVHDILMAHNEGLDTFDLAVRLKKKKSLKFQGLDEVPVLIALCGSVETVGEDLHRLRFDQLRGRAEQAVRVMSEHGSPMTRQDLLREINRRSPRDKELADLRTLIGQLSGDSRLQPIGKSGSWTLVEWGLETRPLVDVIEDVLADADEALPRDEIIERVLAKRTGATASIAMTLDFHPDRFRKVGLRMYALAAWGPSTSDENWWDGDSVADFVVSFLASRSGEVVDFKELREAFARETGLSRRSAQGVLAFHPAVEVDRSDSRRRTVRIRPNWESFRRERRTRKQRPLQAEHIVDLALKILAESTIGETQLVEIVRQIEAKLGIQRANIYAAIAQSDEIETVAVDSSPLKICRLPGRNRPAFPQLSKLTDMEWRLECERGTKMLTVDDVDMGLFILGRQFDQSMRHLLEGARDHGGMTVTDHHLKSLGNRINWAADQKIFSDPTILNLLKSERNARGHEPATLAERKALLKFAPFWAELYIDYLLIIEQQLRVFIACKMAPLTPT